MFGQINGNWVLEKKNSIDKDTVSFFKKDRIVLTDTFSLLTLDEFGTFNFCEEYTEKQTSDGGMIVGCVKSIFSDGEYIYQNDSIRLIFFNNCFRLTKNEMNEMSDEDLKNHFKIFGKSKIMRFKVILKTNKSLVLVKINLP